MEKYVHSGMGSFNNTNIWRAIDILAQKCGLTPSGLALRIGLTSTAFNPSKRAKAKEDELRGLSMETVARVLAETQTSPQEFTALLNRIEAARVNMPGDEKPKRTETVSCIFRRRSGNVVYFGVKGATSEVGFVLTREQNAALDVFKPANLEQRRVQITRFRVTTRGLPRIQSLARVEKNRHLTPVF